MSVKIPLVAVLVGRMNVQIRDHATADKLGLHPLAQGFAVGLKIEFMRKRHKDVTGKLGADFKAAVLLHFGLFNGVPKLLTIIHPRGRVVGCHDLRMKNALLAREIACLAVGFINDLIGGAVGCGTASLAASAPSDDLEPWARTSHQQRTPKRAASPPTAKEWVALTAME